MGFGSLIKKIPINKIPIKKIVSQLPMGRIVGVLVKKGGDPKASFSVTKVGVYLLLIIVLLTLGNSEQAMILLADLLSSLG